MINKRIMIINYGMGNIGSVANALNALGSNYFISGRKEDLYQAGAYILPGVGAFPAAMQNLQKLALIDELTEQTLVKGKPFLGICLGMQLLAKDSMEQEYSTGLGWIDGHVLKLEPSDGLRIPHVGWNNVTFSQRIPLFGKIAGDSHFYFDHSFHFRCAEEIISATCDYGGIWVAAIQSKNVFATQFHPEKSQRNGLKLLRNFLNFVEAH